MNENNDAFMKCQTKKHVPVYRITNNVLMELNKGIPKLISFIGMKPLLYYIIIYYLCRYLFFRRPAVCLCVQLFATCRVDAISKSLDATHNQNRALLPLPLLLCGPYNLSPYHTTSTQIKTPMFCFCHIFPIPTK